MEGNLMAGICQSLRASHARARHIRDHGYVPQGLEAVMSKRASVDYQFRKAMDVWKDGIEAYSVTRTAQRSALKELHERAAEEKESLRKENDDLEATLG